jgi:hypothetical protein
MSARDPDDIVEVAQRQVRRDLQEQRPGLCPHRRALARIDHARKQIVERACLLQIAQARRVR